ncbi:MAG: restriction endonuclease [Rhizobiales bacterium]|nr:restriction endonuclease [Hyphomicrobiales bacterium]
MTIPDYQSLMLPVLRSAAAGEVRISKVVDQLADELNLTEDERSELLPSGRQTIFSNRVHWAKTYLSKAGLLESTRRAHFILTDRGRMLLSQNPTRIDNECLSQFPEFVEFRSRRKADEERPDHITPEQSLASEDKTPDEIIRTAHQELNQTLRDELLDRILASSPAFFEQLVVNLLIEMGYGGSIEEAGRKLGRSGDGGVDGVIDQDALGLDRVYVQAKRYMPGNTVGSGAVRDFFGSLDRFKAAKGIIIATSSFTRDAIETGEQLSKKIVLIDGDQLAGLMVRYNVGCRVDEALYLKKIDEDFFGN